MKHVPRIATAAIAALAAGVAVATPAFAAPPSFDGDQQELHISKAGCDLGYQASGLYDNRSTNRVSFTYDRASGSVTSATCTFRGVPGRVDAKRTADGSETWYRPEPGTTRAVTPCLLYGLGESHPGYDPEWGAVDAVGTLTFARGGTVVTTCTVDLNG